jgi:Uma2 family endonuclease
MATATSSKPVALGDGQRFLLRNVGWDGYEALLRIVGDQPVRLTYDRGDLELMSPPPKHERKKSLLGQFVRALARELQIPVMPVGSTTWKREDLDRGLEADESFYLGDLERLADPDLIDLTVDPPPDLAIEIEITQSALSRISIYAALCVPELWRYDGQTLKVMIRQKDGTYRQSEQSLAFPGFRIDAIADFANRESIRDENAILDQFTAWVRDEIAKQGNRP